MKFSDIAAQLEAYAEQALLAVEAEGKVIIQELEPVIESDFAKLVSELGQIATLTVANLMTSAGAAMSGGEKLNLTATTLMDAAEKAAIQVTAADITALAKNAYTAVTGKALEQQ